MKANTSSPSTPTVTNAPTCNQPRRSGLARTLAARLAAALSIGECAGASGVTPEKWLGDRQTASPFRPSTHKRTRAPSGSSTNSSPAMTSRRHPSAPRSLTTPRHTHFRANPVSVVTTTVSVLLMTRPRRVRPPGRDECASSSGSDSWVGCRRWWSRPLLRCSRTRRVTRAVRTFVNQHRSIAACRPGTKGPTRPHLLRRPGPWSLARATSERDNVSSDNKRRCHYGC